MHISDLHRTDTRHNSNAELLSGLIKDADQFTHQSPAISRPDAIIVTGDLVQGLPLDSSDYPKLLEDQYNTALSLLVELANRFVGGDRTKVIIIPGNHDVDWNMAFRAMVPVDSVEDDPRHLLAMENSPYRVRLETLQLLKIAKESAYAARFKYFCNLYSVGC
jgi:UDP-2,3-diacylglucosamine pyrophosphatase LpxH